MKQKHNYIAPRAEIINLSAILMNGYAQLESTSSMPDSGMDAPKRREGAPAF